MDMAEHAVVIPILICIVFIVLLPFRFQLIAQYFDTTAVWFVAHILSSMFVYTKAFLHLKTQKNATRKNILRVD